MIAVRSWSANPFGELRSHYVIPDPTPEIRSTPDRCLRDGAAETHKACIAAPTYGVRQEVGL